MATLHFKQKTTATPAQFVAGLTDFGPGRKELFPNSADDYLKVHELGATDADVTEGSGGIWERLHYDWSNPEHVVLTTTDSNTWGRNSGHTYNLTPQPDGGTEIELISVREGKNFKGRFLEFILGSVGKGKLKGAFEASVKAIEARDDEPKAAGAA